MPGCAEYKDAGLCYQRRVRSGYITGEKLTTAWRCTAQVIGWATAEKRKLWFKAGSAAAGLFCVVPGVCLRKA